MAKRMVRNAPEFKRQMVDLLRSGRTAASLANEFSPSAWTIALWVKQDARNSGTGDGGLTSEELARLRRENRRLKERTRDPVRSRGLVRNGERRNLEALFGFAKVNQATHSVGTICRVLKISRSGFYAWLN